MRNLLLLLLLLLLAQACLPVVRLVVFGVVWVVAYGYFL